MGSKRKVPDAPPAPLAADRRARILREKEALPITSAKERLIEEVKANPTLIVIGETGSGKTTRRPRGRVGREVKVLDFLLGYHTRLSLLRGEGAGAAAAAAEIPQFLHEAGFTRGGRAVAVTQPRRVAAVTVATRVAEELGVRLGQEVGYSIRFEDATSLGTRLKYMTDGMLLREALLDPLLTRYRVVVLDEAHERTVHTDVLFALLKGVQKRREEEGDEPLRLIIMSATLDAKHFCEYFGGAKAVYVQGRQFPVDVMYTPTPEEDYMDAAIVAVFQIHEEEEEGDILVFLTGQEEIESVHRLLLDRMRRMPEGSQELIVRASDIPISF